MAKPRRPRGTGAARPGGKPLRARSLILRFARSAGRMVLGVLPRALRGRAANDPQG